ncbi:MAG: cell division protein SepF [Clostridia bacterium]|nr:cell division protein SepF [Clostridia bacterium]
MGLFGFLTKNDKNKTREKDAEQSAHVGKADFTGNITTFSPKSFDEVQDVIDCLLSGKPAIVDLSAVRGSTAQRVLDILSGATYAIDGNMGEIKEDAYIFTPNGSIKN